MDLKTYIVIIQSTSSISQKGIVLLITGPTGVGKTNLSFGLARHFSAPIISVDSRQIYKELPIGTAAPTMAERMEIPHHMVGTISIHDTYNVARYESEVIPLIQNLLESHPVVLLVGGSMLYINAITHGIDDMPDIDMGIRESLNKRYEEEGLAPLLEELSKVDEAYLQVVDRKNHKRIIHGLEFFYSTGKQLSSFRTNPHKQRPFTIVPLELTRPREVLYERINQRTDQMIEQGWIEEARSVYEYRDLNALNTIGYKELFQYFDGLCTLEEALRKIKRSTRIYARKQITWLKKQDFQKVDADISVEKLLSEMPF